VANSEQQRRVEDRLWELIEPLIPRRPVLRVRVGGRGSMTGPH
jgi:hypothetical protein